MPSRRNHCNVVIAGAGLAAAATAVSLCANGFKPLIIARACRVMRGVEALPATALALFSELGIGQILEQIGATLVQDFENCWDPQQSHIRSGYWIHVERSRLAAAMLREALRRGASFRVVQSIPELHRNSEQLVHICIDGERLEFRGAIDGTGRAAVWSRPIRRMGSQVADLYELAACGRVMPAKIVRLPQGWAYSMATRDHGSIAVLSPHGKALISKELIERALSVSLRSSSYTGRRPAFPQWSQNPIERRRISVGDAALAYDPLAGQGIRFALSTALAAASVIKTWRADPSRFAAAESFYRAFVERSRKVHLEFVAHWKNEHRSPALQKRLVLPKAVVFSDRVAQTELHWSGEIRTDLAFRLPDGGFVRWAAGTDLIQLRNETPGIIGSAELINRLIDSCGDLAQARQLVEWCLRQQILLPAAPACNQLAAIFEPQPLRERTQRSNPETERISAFGDSV